MRASPLRRATSGSSFAPSGNRAPARPSSVSWVVAGVVEVLVQHVEQVSAFYEEAPPQPQAHGVGHRRPVERRGHRRSPVGDDRLAVAVLYMAAADVEAFPRGRIDTAEAKRGGR